MQEQDSPATSSKQMVEDVALTLYVEQGAHQSLPWIEGEWVTDEYRRLARAAIDAARPHLREQLYAELIAESQGKDFYRCIVNSKGDEVEHWLKQRRKDEAA